MSSSLRVYILVWIRWDSTVCAGTACLRNSDTFWRLVVSPILCIGVDLPEDLGFLKTSWIYTRLAQVNGGNIYGAGQDAVNVFTSH